jgi:hypothetical protein
LYEFWRKDRKSHICLNIGSQRSHQRSRSADATFLRTNTIYMSVRHRNRTHLSCTNKPVHAFSVAQLYQFNMKTTPKYSNLFVLSLLLSSVFIASEARPFNVMEPRSSTALGGFFDGLSLGGIKQSGPSPPGPGHQFANHESTLGRIKDGPSPPGEGHN